MDRLERRVIELAAEVHETYYINDLFAQGYEVRNIDLVKEVDDMLITYKLNVHGKYAFHSITRKE